MPKSINFGNGVTLIGLDKFGQIKDLYYHYPGLENHVGNDLEHKIGFFIDSRFSWIDDPIWRVSVRAVPGSMASDITAYNEEQGIELNFTDVLYNEKNIFIRKIEIKNIFDKTRNIKLFFNQQFNIEETHIGDTAYFDPREEVIIHYKGRRVFLVNSLWEEVGFDEYSIGLIGLEGKVGTYKDAEDGLLSMNPIEHGEVDSVIASNISVQPKKSTTFYYWLCIGRSIEIAKKLNEEVVARGPYQIVDSTVNYWRTWVGVRSTDFLELPKEVIELYKKSLLYMKSHTADNGAIIASGDSEMLQFGRDYYRYVWHRDAAVTAMAFTEAGYYQNSKLFFQFCNDTITPEGFFMHKYRPDKSIGSSWHPWIVENKARYPIQEDETALVIFALWEYYELSRDVEFIESVYNSLIKPACEFMVKYRDGKTGLPMASYDIWEQFCGISTYTSATVYGALKAGANLSKLFGKNYNAGKYEETAEDIKKAILKYLYTKEEGYFYKLIYENKGKNETDRTIDASSVYGIYKFGVLDAGDPIIKKAVEITNAKLEVKTEVGGIARYEGDDYHFLGGDYPGNPWIITTLRLAQYYIAAAKNKNEMEKALDIIKWATKYANPAGILPEQLNPFTGEHLSASPLIESHGEFVTTVIMYLEKYIELN